MIQRFLILLGAQTTAGGTVASASSFISYNGVKYALEGDLIDCPSCASQGVIKCVPPRLSTSYSGRQVALEHDLCICKCSPPPQLIANQTHNSQWIDAGGDAMSDPAAAKQAVNARLPASAADEDSMPLRLLDSTTREPFRNRPYKLDLRGKAIEGVTDGEGFTEPLSAAERASLTAWHVADPAA